jgi:hypothetical protein
MSDLATATREGTILRLKTQIGTTRGEMVGNAGL